MAVGEFSYDEEKQQIRINLLGSIYGASIEDFDIVMATVIEKLLSIKKVTSIVLVKDREYEYSGSQVTMLQEIAGVLEDIIHDKVISYGKLRPDKCSKCYPDITQRLQYICINLLRRDPIGAYVELKRESRSLRIKLEHKDRCQPCFRYYKEKIVDPLKLRMEQTSMIKLVKDYLSGYHIGDRGLYRQILQPSVRPNFMLTRYMIAPPENGRSVDKYRIGDVQVEIYKLPNTAEYFYHTSGFPHRPCTAAGCKGTRWAMWTA